MEKKEPEEESKEVKQARAKAKHDKHVHRLAQVAAAEARRSGATMLQAAAAAGAVVFQDGAPVEEVVEAVEHACPMRKCTLGYENTVPITIDMR